jgi:hypothetical protein
VAVVISSIGVQGFRGIHEGVVKDLPRLGIFVGANGSGKSSLLEAILIGVHDDPGSAIGQVVRARGTPRGARWLFEKGAGKEVAISIETNDWARTTTLDYVPSVDGGNDVVNFSEDGSYFGQVAFAPGTNDFLRTGDRVSRSAQVRWLEPFSPFQGELHDVYTEVVTAGRRSAAKDIIKAVIPGFENLEILVEAGRPVVHIVLADHSVPVALAGSGISVLIRLALVLAASPGGTVLIEEPETHEHPAAMRQSARAILEATRRGVQVLFSTHSLDFIDTLLADATPEDLNDLAVYRLAKKNGVLATTRIDGPDVLRARGTMEDDLR